MFLICFISARDASGLFTSDTCEIERVGRELLRAGFYSSDHYFREPNGQRDS
jgi:hypothetical protein